jgi:hypothetical protein
VTLVSPRYVRAMDRPADNVSPPSTGPLDPAGILGLWRNTNNRSWGICRAELTQRDSQVWMHVWAADPVEGERDWGEVPIDRLYTDGPFSQVVCGYIATFDLGHARTQIQANQNHGLTVLAAFTTFTDSSGRCGFLSREFFYRR